MRTRVRLDAAEPSFEPQDIEEQTFLDALRDATAAVERAGVPWGLMGGIASAIHGRARYTRDVDLFVRPQDAPAVLDALAGSGFDTVRKNEEWLFKGIRDGVLVDVIFRAKGNIYLDDDMIPRLADAEFGGIPVRTIPPEDLIIIKAIVHDEETPRHWFDALGVIVGSDLDWDYFIKRSAAGARRMLSLLAYAQSCDIVVPDRVIKELTDTLYEGR